MSQEQDPGAIPGHSTNSQNYGDVNLNSIYPGRGGIRIDWLVKVEGDCPDVSSVNANKRIDANDNALNNVTFVNFGKQKSVVNEDFALAA